MEKIIIENYDKIHPYSVARKDILQYWHDQAWLIKRPYFFEIKDRVLYIYKNIYFTRYVFLAMPPMTLDCDYHKEYDLMMTSEYDCVYSNEWAKNIISGFDEPDHHEWIYHTKTYRPENLTGKKNRKWRNALNKLNKDGYKFEFFKYDKDDFYLSSHVLNVLVPEMRKLTNQWLQEKQKKDSTKFFWMDLIDSLKDVYILTLKDSTGRLVGYNITQQLGNTIIYSCEKFLESEFQNFPVMKAVHIKLSEYYRYTFGKEMFLNKGGDVNDKGMKNNKNLLRPYIKLELYKVRWG